MSLGQTFRLVEPTMLTLVVPAMRWMEKWLTQLEGLRLRCYNKETETTGEGKWVAT